MDPNKFLHEYLLFDQYMFKIWFNSECYFLIKFANKYLIKNVILHFKNQD